MSTDDPAGKSPQSYKLRLLCALAVLIASLGVYSWTLAPTVTFIDSGELVVAARSLGVAHPPGFPLYVVLAHLATLIPLGNVAFRVNFASALFAAMSSAVLTLAVGEALIAARLSVGVYKGRTKEVRKRKKNVGAKAQSNGDIESVVRSTTFLTSCTTAGLLFGFSRTLWGYATITEVYTLNSLLILAIFLLMFRWRRSVLEMRSRPAGSRPEESKHLQSDVQSVSEKTNLPSTPGGNRSVPDRLLYSAAFLFGLALGVHHVSVGLMLPALAVLAFATEGFRRILGRRLVYAALFAFAGLALVYAYLLIGASRSPIMNWGDPRTFQRLWWHVTGRQYQVFFSFSLKTMFDQFGGFVGLAAREFGPWWLPLSAAFVIAGFIALFRRDKAMFWFLSAVIIANLAYSLGYEIAEDKDAYYLPTFIAVTIAAGFGVEWFINKVSSATKLSERFGITPVRRIAAGLVLLVPIAALVANWPYNNRRHYLLAKDYVDNILSTVAPRGMLLTRDWQVYSPMLYFCEIEHRRDDVSVIDVNQLRRSWYFDYLRTRYPAMIEQSHDKVDAFLEDLRQWEQDPDLYQRDLMLNQRINSRFYEMILAFVTNHIQSAPVYVTLEIAANREGTDSELTKSLTASYQLIPEGLVFQVTPDRAFRQPADGRLNLRGLADGTLKFRDDDVVSLKVLPVYVTMIYNRGRYLAVNGRHDQAIQAYNQSLALNPRFTIAQQSLNESLSAIKKGPAPNPQ